MNAQELAAEIQGLAPPDRLRLAAALMEQRKGDVAYPIVRQGAAIALLKLGRVVP